jgi:hypothetical protein
LRDLLTVLQLGFEDDLRSTLEVEGELRFDGRASPRHSAGENAAEDDEDGAKPRESA